MSGAETGRFAPQKDPREIDGTRLTLEPLRALGPDALDTQGIPQIFKITLLEIEIVADNAFHQVTVWRADNLFDCAAADGPFYQPIPETGTITRAVFEIQFSDSCVTVEIRIPDVITLPPDRPVPSLETWLIRCGIRTSQKVCQILIILGLALATAAAPAFDDTDDDDDDDDDDDNNRHHAHVIHSRRSQSALNESSIQNPVSHSHFASTVQRFNNVTMQRCNHVTM